MKADLLLTGRIATLAGEAGFGWVEAIATRDGRIVAAGSRVDVTAAADAARRIDLPPDRCAIPGLSDGHIHLADLALAVDEVDLSDVSTLDEGIERVRAAHLAMTDPEAWIEGHGWDAVRWGGWPGADDLERAAPGRRVALWSHDHHAVWASFAALAAARVDASTPDPPGGVIRRLDDGFPAGCLHEAAVPLVLRVVPPPDPEHLDRSIVAACRELLSLGLTAVHDPGEVAADLALDGGLAAYERLASRAALPLRVHTSVRPESLELAIARGLRSGEPLGGHGSRASVGWVKIFADGTLGARTARMLEPFEEAPDRGDPPGGPLGVDVTAPEEVARVVARAAANGIAAQVHAIGDGAVRSSLDALAGAPRTRLMPRIEHAQLVDAADLERFAASDIAACVMPRDIRADAANSLRFWGRRRTEHGAYAFGSLVRTGAVVAFGTDAPVESPDPWPAIVSAVTRRAPGWSADEAFVPGEAMSLERAIRAACLDAAIAAGEHDRGRLVPGARADLVVIPTAALEEPVDPSGPLETVRPDLVVIDGEVVFDR